MFYSTLSSSQCSNARGSSSHRPSYWYIFPSSMERLLSTWIWDSVLFVQCLAECSPNAQTGLMGIPVIQTQVIYLHLTHLHVTKQMLLLSRAKGWMQYPSDSACVRGSRDLPDKPYGTFIYKVVYFEMYCLRTCLSNNCVVYKHKIVLIWWEVWIKCSQAPAPSLAPAQCHWNDPFSLSNTCITSQMLIPAHPNPHTLLTPTAICHESLPLWAPLQPLWLWQSLKETGLSSWKLMRCPGCFCKLLPLTGQLINAFRCTNELSSSLVQLQQWFAYTK